ncbi:MAG TPA: hypothetical protein VNT20_09860 [Flavisolibacter sp.]|jgi:hypothetical protein|nr:hypothetical protein [Flavisolibacter sp.]
MDCRVTLNIDENFFELLKTSYHSGAKVYLLVDEGGITREEGFIVKMDENTVSPQCIEMDSGIKIPVKKIIAVNGTFLPEFGEC